MQRIVALFVQSLHHSGLILPADETSPRAFSSPGAGALDAKSQSATLTQTTTGMAREVAPPLVPGTPALHAGETLRSAYTKLPHVVSWKSDALNSEFVRVRM